MAIFQKNITSKMDENGLKYRYRTNLHFDIGLGWLVHEKFFTAAKLRFLAGQASLLDEASTGTQNWSVRAVTSSNQSISVIFTDIQAIFGHLGPLSAMFGLFKPQTQNCRTDKISVPFISNIEKGRGVSSQVTLEASNIPQLTPKSNTSG